MGLPTIPQMRVEIDRLKGKGASEGLSIKEVCVMWKEATGRTAKPVAAVVQEKAGDSIPTPPKYLSPEALGRLSHGEQIAHHKQYAEYYSAKIVGLGHTPKSLPPVDSGDLRKEAGNWDGHACHLIFEHSQIVKSMSNQTTTQEAEVSSLTPKERLSNGFKVEGAAGEAPRQANPKPHEAATAREADGPTPQQRLAQGFTVQGYTAEEPKAKQEGRKPALTKGGEAFRQPSDL